MSHSRTGRFVAVAIVVTTTQLALAASAGAITAPPVWQCRASVGYATLAGGSRAESIVANGTVNSGRGRDPDRALCASGEAGGGNLGDPLSIPADLLAARTATATTKIEPEFGAARDQKVTATARVENLTVQLPQGEAVVLGVVAAESTATAGCAAGDTAPRLAGTSHVAGLTLGGTALSVDALVAELTRRLAALNPLVKVTANELIRTADSLTVRALHVVVLGGGGGAPLVDVVVAETKVGFNGTVCAAPDRPSICPEGSDFVASRDLCIIQAGAGGSQMGDIIVGRPSDGLSSGGTVVPLDVSRKRYGSSPCLSGSSPRFVIVDTKGTNRITGTIRADRILGLSGSDRIEGAGAGDCVDGGTGNDRVSAGAGNDRAYGAAGKDHLNGGSGNDRAYGGAGNDHFNGGPGADHLDGGPGRDTINAGHGADRTFGGGGDDAINIATAGRRASASCGSGRDTVRLNQNERKRVKGCEKVYVLKDR